MQNMEGQLLGNRYELIERIGGGGMAVVYKARCRLLNRYVAVKILRTEFTDDEEFVKRFRIEAQAAASLSHPNIVPIFDVGHDNNIHYIVMEYVDGITLKEYIRQMGPLPWKDAVGIAVQICSALEQAHKNHVVHRDIKPHNILITKEGIAKVTDFGIARAVTSATITMVGSTIGSVHYFSPEQARGGFTDEKSDLYSLGITIYEMVTGKVPFDGDSPVAVALKHIQEKPERPIDVNPSIPKAVNDLILKAIRKDQNLRYQSATEMLTDLQRILGEPNITISGSDTVEELPTRKMQAVGKDVELAEDDLEADDKGDKEEEGGEKDPAKKSKKDKMSVWLGIATGVVIAGILLFVGLRFIIPAIFPQSQEDYVVLDFTNRNFNDVQAELEKSDINAVDRENIYSDTVAEGVIISQDTQVGNKLKPGSTIKFTVSSGPELVQVPDVTGKEYRIGEQEIQNENLEPSRINEYNDKVGTGLIIRTDPAYPEKIKPSETVTVYVSLGPELAKVKVPQLVGLTRSAAEKLITDNLLTMGKTLPEGVVSDVAKVIRQYPDAGKEVDEGTAVELTFAADTAQNQNSQTNSGQNAGSKSGQSSTNTTPGDSQSQDTATKTELLRISLKENRTYGDEVSVYVEETPSDTNERVIVMNKSIAKSRFPADALFLQRCFY